MHTCGRSTTICRLVGHGLFLTRLQTKTTSASDPIPDIPRSGFNGPAASKAATKPGTAKDSNGS